MVQHNQLSNLSENNWLLWDKELLNHGKLQLIYTWLTSINTSLIDLLSSIFTTIKIPLILDMISINSLMEILLKPLESLLKQPLSTLIPLFQHIPVSSLHLHNYNGPWSQVLILLLFAKIILSLEMFRQSLILYLELGLSKLCHQLLDVFWSKVQSISSEYYK